MFGNKLISLLILLILSLVPFFAVIYLWNSILPGMGIAGIILVVGIPALFPFIVSLIVFGQHIITDRFNLYKLPLYIVIAIPVVINLISTQWYFIRVDMVRREYFSRYEGMELNPILLKGEFIPNTTQAYNFAGEYKYKVLLKNNNEKSYKDVDLWLTLKYTNTKTDTIQELGNTITKVNLSPGDNIIEGDILINTYVLRCDYLQFRSPITLKITQKVLERDTSVDILLSEHLIRDLIIINNNLEKVNEGALHPIRACNE